VGGSPLLPLLDYRNKRGSDSTATATAMNVTMLRRSAAAVRAHQTQAAAKAAAARGFSSSAPATATEPAKPSWGEVIEKLSNTFFLTDVFRASWLSWEVHVERKVTINYPFEKGMLSPRFRGEHALRRYPSGEERCVSPIVAQRVC
jgi:hypothetical protein